MDDEQARSFTEVDPSAVAAGLEKFRQVDGTRSGYRSKMNAISKIFLRQKLNREDLILPNTICPSKAKKPRVMFEMPDCRKLGDSIVKDIFYWIAVEPSLSKAHKNKEKNKEKIKEKTKRGRSAPNEDDDDESEEDDVSGDDSEDMPTDLDEGLSALNTVYLLLILVNTLKCLLFGRRLDIFQHAYRVQCKVSRVG